MANIKDCPGFETFGADVKAARSAKHLSRKTLAEIINIDSRYLANIENDATIPSLPVIIQLIKVCGLPVERYFNPEIMREESAQRQRISHKLKLCPEQYLTVIEGALDGALKTEKSADEMELALEDMGKPIGVADYQLIVPKKELEEVLTNEIKKFGEEKGGK